MNEEIKAYIVAQCLKMGLKEVETSHIAFNEMHFENEFVTVLVETGQFDDLYIFEMWNIELRKELMFRFLIPETLRGFMQVCNILKVFHQ